MTNPSAADVQELTASIRTISGEVGGLRVDVERETRTRHKLTIAAVVLIAVCLVIGLAAVVVGRNAQATADDIQRARSAAIEQSCNVDNARLDQQRAAYADVADAIKAGAAAVFVSAPGATSEQQERVQMALAAYNASVDAAIAAAVAKVPQENSGVSCRLLGR